MKSAAGVDGQLTNFWMQACYSSLLSNPDFSSSLKLCLWAMFLSVPRYMYWCSAASQVKWDHCFWCLFCVHHIYTFTHGNIPHIKRNPHQLWNFSWFFPIIFKFPKFFTVFQVDGHFVNAAWNTFFTLNEVTVNYDTWPVVLWLACLGIRVPQPNELLWVTALYQIHSTHKVSVHSTIMVLQNGTL